MGTTIDNRHSWLVFVAALALVAMAVVLALAVMRPPPPLAADAPASTFSAERAFEHIERLARVPRPVGSAAHDSVASYLLTAMEQLGLETEVQETTWVRSSGGRNVAVRVRNLLGRLPGSAGGDSLLLLAHYDSQPQTRGAGDDAAGVAVVLEAVRALSTGARPRNEILVAITDAEELGLFGAQALAAEHPWFERADLVLNVEARGNRGLAMMFETADGGLPWVRDLARLAPYPVADSLSYEVYQRMPNDTDFSMVREAGKEGLNFAFVDGHPAYHSALDTAQALELATVQQLGANILSLVEHYAQQPIAATGAREGVYFNLGSIRRLGGVCYLAGARSAGALGDGRGHPPRRPLPPGASDAGPFWRRRGCLEHLPGVDPLHASRTARRSDRALELPGGGDELASGRQQSSVHVAGSSSEHRHADG